MKSRRSGKGGHSIAGKLTERFLLFLGPRLGPALLLLMARTWRMRVRGWDTARAYIESGKPLVMITWHGRMMVPVMHSRGRGIVAMISQHNDGEIVARLVQKLGYDTVRGSSTRGGAAAALELLEKVKNGQTAAMICDGPRGPIYKMKPGAPFLALQARATVIPATFAAGRAWILRSWDRFQIPKPFARVHLLFGEPIPFPGEDTDLREFTRTLETALVSLTEEADALAGR